MTEIVMRRQTPPINWLGVPDRYIGKCSAVCRTLQECEELVRWFGDASFAPYAPVLVKAPAGWTAITGWGYADAAELQDCAVVLWNRQEAALKEHGALLNFDELRERNGLMRKEDVPAALAEALTQRIAKHKTNPVTDPFRQPQAPRVRGKTVFAQTQGTEWKDVGDLQGA